MEIFNVAEKDIEQSIRGKIKDLNIIFSITSTNFESVADDDDAVASSSKEKVSISEKMCASSSGFVIKDNTHCTVTVHLYNKHK